MITFRNPARNDNNVSIRTRITVFLALAFCATAVCLISCDDDDDDTPAVAIAPVEHAIPFITDRDGGVLILHGTNVMSSSKSHPQRLPDITPEDVRRISRDWGWNLVRYLIFWDAVEPQPGVYDEAYFALTRERLDWFAAEGVHVVLDMHQDVYAQRFCCDGAPEWAIRDNGEPFELQPQWFLNYMQPAVQASFDNFWNYGGPHSDLQDHYGDAWKAVVSSFKDHPAVLGYDIMNEPHPGSLVDLPEILTGIPSPNSRSPEFDRDFLTPFYQRIINKIREVDSEGWIFYEPRYGAPGNGLPSYHGKFEDPREGVPRLAYFPHLYSLKLEATGQYRANDTTIPDWEHNRRREADAQAAPLLCGEWGLLYDTVNGATFTREVCEMLDRQLAGWTYWSHDAGGFGYLNGDGTERDNLDILVRPYPRRIAGIPVSYSFAPDSKTFEFTWHPLEGTRGSTEISLPAKRHYTNGWDIQASMPDGAWSWSWNEETQILTIDTTSSADAYSITVSAR